MDKQYYCIPKWKKKNLKNPKNIKFRWYEECEKEYEQCEDFSYSSYHFQFWRFFFLKKILVISINFMWKIAFINYLLVLNGECERIRFENGAMDGEISRICDRNTKVEDLILEMKKFIY